MRRFRHYCSVMEPLSFPNYSFRFQEADRKKMIFDVVRKKFVALTPEEWVRQHCIHFLLEEKEVPLSLVGVESSIQYQGMNRRCDLLIYKAGKPNLLVECKAPDIPLNAKVVEQLARYQSVVQVPFMWITNGIHHLMLQLSEGKLERIDALPQYSNW
ncbi:MAG: type I restriction enzyme HsdR N-terminal domain-containing protein [Bacteroidetes bacterium]|nr:MAG: type I restriction enzyme HsdR N-terminal domain-containing protein [Bacteroidota bacterium]